MRVHCELVYFIQVFSWQNCNKSGQNMFKTNKNHGRWHFILNRSKHQVGARSMEKCDTIHNFVHARWVLFNKIAVKLPFLKDTLVGWLHFNRDNVQRRQNKNYGIWKIKECQVKGYGMVVWELDVNYKLMPSNIGCSCGSMDWSI